MSTYFSPETSRLLLILAITIAARLGAKILFRHLEKATSKTQNIWDDALLEAARAPLPFFIWLTGAFFALRLIRHQTGEHLLEYIAEAQMISVVACLAWFLLRLTRSVADNAAKAQSQIGIEVDRTTIDGLSKLARVIIFIISALVILQSLGFSISGVLAFGGVGGIAIGFAARDLLANFFGGLMIHLDRPFNVGESVRSPDKQIEGKVEQIGWRQTMIRSPNMTPIYVPNSLFTSIVVENPTRMSHRRIREIIGLRYEDLDKMGIIVEEVRAMLQNHPDIDAEGGVVVGFDQFAESSLNFIVQAYSKCTESATFQAIKQDVLLKVADIITKHGADFAFPTRTLVTQTA